jgi:hypothetical protein
MFEITVGAIDSFDNQTNEFVKTSGTALQMEHSLFSISKWESKWEIPFLAKEEKTEAQILDYIKTMTLTPDVSQKVWDSLTADDYSAISEYINAKMTATWFADDPNAKPNREIITSEIVYYWMIALTIPVEFEHWHFNRLLTLIQVCNRKNSPEKKTPTTRSSLADRKALNDARKAQMNSKG